MQNFVLDLYYSMQIYQLWKILFFIHKCLLTLRAILNLHLFEKSGFSNERMDLFC